MSLISIDICPICRQDNLVLFQECEDHTTTHQTFTILRCSSCTFVITNPRPDDLSLGQYYASSNYISHTNKADGLINRIYLRARTFTMKWKIDLIKKYKQPTQILDYGCGTGDLLTQYKLQGWTISGVEPSPDARAKASIQTGIDIAAHFSDLKQPTFDVITLWHVLEHIPDFQQKLLELTNRLDKNGVLLIAVPNHESPDARRYQRYWAAYDVPRHLWHFNKKNMQTVIEQAGLRLTKIHPMKLDSYYVSLLSEKYKTSSPLSATSFIRGLINGARSNRAARKNVNHSSLIYIAQK